MDKACTHQAEETTAIHLQNHSPKLCFPLASLGSSDCSKPFSIFAFWVSKSLRNFSSGTRFSNEFCFLKLPYNFMVVNNSVFCSSPGFDEGQKGKMEALIENGECNGQKIEHFADNVSQNETVGESTSASEESTPSSDFFSSDTAGNEGRRRSLSDDSSSLSTGWSVEKTDVPDCSSAKSVEGGEALYFDEKKSEKNIKLQKQCSTMSEMEMMKDRFSKLLLGEDMSGCGNGVSTALAISNAITNLSATLFGQLWRLEPFSSEKKLMWRREIEWLLCVSDHIVELIPNWQTFPDGTKLEVMTCRPRADLYVNLPALRKLDNMLLDMLDSFKSREFWYVDQGILAPDVDGSSTFGRALQRQEEKWWLPVPRVPPGGLHENTRKQLQHKRDCTNQILKAAMAINSVALADMDVPESYLGSLPKNGRASLGDVIYRYISLDPFSPECILDCLVISSEHQAIEAANRIEASMHLWRKKTNSRPSSNTTRSSSKSSWEVVKELMIDADKWDLLADRAETLLLCLKQRFPGLSQTALDMTKIQHNKDVGKSILESYSRVLESLAFNIVARIEDLLHVDDLTKHHDQFSSLSESGMISKRSSSSAPICTTPYKSASTSPNTSPLRQLSPVKGGHRSPMPTTAISQRGLGMKKVLTDYLTIERKETEFGNLIGKSGSITSVARQMRVYDDSAPEK